MCRNALLVKNSNKHKVENKVQQSRINVEMETFFQVNLFLPNC